jgi:hypothetical protein
MLEFKASPYCLINLMLSFAFPKILQLRIMLPYQVGKSLGKCRESAKRALRNPDSIFDHGEILSF